MTYFLLIWLFILTLFLKTDYNSELELLIFGNSLIFLCIMYVPMIHLEKSK